MDSKTRPGLLRKLSIVTHSGRLRELILSYIDEVTKVDQSGWFHSPEFSKVAGLPPSKRYQFFGFLRSEVAERQRFDKDANTELEACANWWSDKTGDRKTKALHHVFAIAPELAGKLEKAGLPIGDVLFDCVKRSYESYCQQFYPNDEIAFVAGLHREKAHPHVHCLVYPQTKSGRRLNFSRLAPARFGGREVRVDFQGYLQERFADNVERYREMVAEPGRNGFPALLPEVTLLAGALTKMADAREDQGSKSSRGELINEAARTLTAATDLSGVLIQQRQESLARARQDREELIRKGALKVLAETFAEGGRKLAAETGRVKEQKDREALAVRASRFAARLLETAASVRGETPAYLEKPIDVHAVRTRRLGPAISQQRLEEAFAAARSRQESIGRIVPLATLINRDLAPVYHASESKRGIGDVLPIPELTDGEAGHRERRLGAVVSIDATISPDQIALEVNRRALDLEISSGVYSNALPTLPEL